MANSETQEKLQQALLSLRTEASLSPKALPSKDADEDEGGASTAGGGSGGIVIDKVLFAEVFGLQRVSEKLFGPVGDFDPIAYAAEEAQQKHEQGQEQNASSKGTLKAHPILSKLAKFAGDTSKMSMNPQENQTAQNRNELRLSLKMSLKNNPNSAPKPKPGGM